MAGDRLWGTAKYGVYEGNMGAEALSFSFAAMAACEAENGLPSCRPSPISLRLAWPELASFRKLILDDFRFSRARSSCTDGSLCRP